MELGTADRETTIQDVFQAVRALFDGRNYTASVKEDGTLVTALDRRVQEAALEILARRHPDELVWAEEDNVSVATMDEATVRWAVDPIDGTTNFARHVPLYAVSVAAVQGRRALTGAVWHVSHDEVYWPEDSTGWAAYGTLYASSLSLAVDYEGSDVNRAIGAEVVHRAIPRFRSVRIIGSTALGLAWTARGRYDVFFHPRPKIWDYAAGAAMILSAGGRILSPEVGEEAPYLLAGRTEAVTLVDELVHQAVSSSGMRWPNE